MSDIAEKAVVYASLILADENIEVTADKLQAVLDAAGVEVEPIWASIFAKALEGKNINDMITNVGSASAAPVAGVAAAGGAAAGGAAAAKEEEKKEEAAEESDDDMGFGLFD